MPAASFGERTSILSLSPETFLASELTAGQELQSGQKLEEPVAGLSPLPQPHCAPGVSHSPFLTLYRLIYEKEKSPQGIEYLQTAQPIKNSHPKHAKNHQGSMRKLEERKNFK